MKDKSRSLRKLDKRYNPKNKSKSRGINKPINKTKRTKRTKRTKKTKRTKRMKKKIKMKGGASAASAEGVPTEDGTGSAASVSKELAEAKSAEEAKAAAAKQRLAAIQKEIGKLGILGLREKAEGLGLEMVVDGIKQKHEHNRSILAGGNRFHDLFRAQEVGELREIILSKMLEGEDAAEYTETTTMAGASGAFPKTWKPLYIPRIELSEPKGGNCDFGGQVQLSLTELQALLTESIVVNNREAGVSEQEAYRIFERLVNLDICCLPFISSQYTTFISKISRLLGDNVTSHMSLGLVANGFPEWFAEEAKTQSPTHGVDMLVLKIIYETLSPLLSTLQNILETIDVMIHRIIQESKPFIQRKQLVQSAVSSLTLGGSYGAGPVTASVPALPYGLAGAISLDGTEYLRPKLGKDKSKEAYSKYCATMRGFLDTRWGWGQKLILGNIEEELKIMDNFSPESIDFESYLNNLKGLLFSNASLISKFIYNLELINRAAPVDLSEARDEGHIKLLWEGYLLEHPLLYATIDGMCDRCREFVNERIKENKKARMDIQGSHPSIQQTFREPNQSMMTCGGPYFGPTKVLATMLPPSYKTEGKSESTDDTTGKSNTDVTSKDMNGNPVVIEIEAEKAEDHSKGKGQEKARSIMNLPKNFTQYLGLGSPELEIEFKDDSMIANQTGEMKHPPGTDKGGDTLIDDEGGALGPDGVEQEPPAATLWPVEWPQSPKPVDFLSQRRAAQDLGVSASPQNELDAAGADEL